MSGLRKLGTSVTSLVVLLALFSSSAYAKGGGGYSCKGDNVVGSPMQFGITVESSGRIHLSASGGRDRSGTLYPYLWNLYDSAGKQLDYFPEGVLVFVSPMMLAETNLEGLLAGASYTVELVSQDFCANRASVKHSVTMPPASPESQPPVLSVPSLQTGYWGGSFKTIQFSVTDDTGVQEVSVYVNGTLISEDKTFDGVNFRWWTNDYPADNMQSVLEGP